MEVETKKKSCWFSLGFVLLILIALATVTIVFIASCTEKAIGKAAADATIEPANANNEAENRYFSETSDISNGIKAVYEDFINSVDDYNKGFLTLEELKVDSIEFYSGIYTAVYAFNSLNAPVPESLSDYNQYFSKFILEWQKTADHMKNFIKATSNKGMKSELQAALDCIKAADGYTEAANAELNKLKVEETTAAQTKGEEKSTETKSTNIIKYNIIYTVDNARVDGGTTYYLLINSVDLSNDNFKDGIKGIIIRFVKIHGNKVSLNIYDKLETLKNDYKDSVSGKITTLTTDPKFLKDLDLHLIAYYEGDLSAGLYLNTLYFFPAYYYENQSTEKYIETIEFNP